MQTSQRADKWLWHARLIKSRSIAANLIETGGLRINCVKVAKPSHSIQMGDVLTFYHGGRVRLIEVTGFGERRGPPQQAQLLYRDLGKTEVGAQCDAALKN